jgi:subtilisin-like proprotein convertase family protein
MIRVTCPRTAMFASLALVASHPARVRAASATFSNTATVFFPADTYDASPYPSNIDVSGVAGTVTEVTVTLVELSHQYPSDMQVLLVGPTGQTLLLMANVGDGFPVNDVALTFDDTAAASLTSAGITSGTYRPSQLAPLGDIFPDPAPDPPYGATLGVFDGLDPNGTWSLFVADSFIQGGEGNIGLGWRLTITTSDVLPFSGFFAPIDDPPVFNKVKAGTAIPVKFGLGGDQGLDIFAAGSPTSAPIQCDGGVIADPIEETATPGNSGLTYDAASDTYTYVWQTAKSWKNTCRALTVALADDSEHVAYFMFTK